MEKDNTNCVFTEVTFQPLDNKIIYVDRRGNEFESKILCRISDRAFAREDYYNYLLKNRNWFERLFNIKPSMKFYDTLIYKSLSTPPTNN